MDLAAMPARPLLFIENREKTIFWAAVARHLQDCGFAIHWIVQNHFFGKDLPGSVHKIPYPKRVGMPVEGWSRRYPILVTDRGRQHFNAGTAHYDHYADYIRKVMTDVRPAMVIGESTLFHELLSVAIAEELGVPFIHPAAERYPSDRFVMFSGISQTALVESDEAMSVDDARAFAQRVREGSERPVYMQRPSGFKKLAKRLSWIVTRTNIWLAWMCGERYNTPSLTRKWYLTRWANRNRSAWKELERAVPPGIRAVMYPMHVAPEANIDVWGRPFNDQLALIKRLILACPPDVAVAIKANPSPKYEICDSLIELARVEPRLILLPMDMTMAQAMTQTVGAITVSGTVAFEAVFGKGRCISLRHPVLERACPSFAASSPEEGVRRLLEDPRSGVGSDAHAVALLQAIHARSYPGYISDPFSSPACLAPANIERVAAAIAEVTARSASSAIP